MLASFEIDELLRTVGLKDFSGMLVEHELDNFLPTNRYRYCNFLCCDFFVVLYWLAIELSVLKYYPLALTTFRLLIFGILEMNELAKGFELGRLTLFQGKNGDLELLSYNAG